MLTIISAQYKAAQFITRSTMPQDFCMAVYRILHNIIPPQGPGHDWLIIDQYVEANQPVVQWFRTILEDNGGGHDGIEANVRWFEQQLSPHNN